MMVGGLTLDPTTKMPIVVLKDPDNKTQPAYLDRTARSGLDGDGNRGDQAAAPDDP